MFRIAENGWGFNSGISAMYFWVPQDTPSFRIQFRTNMAVGVGRVFAPDGNEAAMASYLAGQTAAVEIKPKPGQTGRLWRLFMSPGNNSNHFSLNGVPPFVCGEPGRFFLPQLKPENEKNFR